MMATPLDQFDTPRHLAERMVGAASQSAPAVVADFAAGSGVLLQCAARRWPAAEVVAVDICPDRVREIAGAHPRWDVARADFLKARSRAQSPVLRRLAGGVDLVLLNPPFSCRGARRVDAACEAGALSCSPAAAFILGSTHYLAPAGEIIAVLPAGSLSSSRDEQAWAHLRAMFGVEVLESHGRGLFGRHFVRTSVVRLGPLGAPGVRAAPPLPATAGDSPRGPHIAVVRGKLQMHKVVSCGAGPSVPLVHTTELRQCAVAAGSTRVPVGLDSIRGPAVLVPRVGEPHPSKVALHEGFASLAISDCVIGLCCPTRADARELHNALLNNWPLLEACYGGTCARYTRVASVEALLLALGYWPDRQASR